MEEKSLKKVEILHEDEDIIVCVKPQGMATQNDKSTQMDLFHYLKGYLYEEHNLETEPELYMVHRLDCPVGGVIVFAKNQTAAAALSLQIKEHSFKKYYQAVLTGELEEEEGTLEDYLLKDSKTNVSKVVDKDTKGAKVARLHYELLDEIETKEGILSYVLIELDTGRHHQIRVQMAHMGAGIWGDTKYNKRFQKTKKVYKQIGLFATRLEFIQPTTMKPVVFQTEPTGEAFELLEVCF